MAGPSRDAIDTFISVTGASEAVALRKLEEHDGDLNRAINGHFSEADSINTNQGSARPQDFLNIDPLDIEPLRRVPLLPAARDVNPFSLLDSHVGLFSSLFDGRRDPGFHRHGPRVSHPREVREVPIEFKDDNTETRASGIGPIIEDVTGNELAHGQEIRGTVIIDDEDEDMTHADHGSKTSTGASFDHFAGPSISAAVSTDYNNDIEEEMIRAAIEASKREVEKRDLHGHPKSPPPDDAELARAVSLSLETAELERALREQGVYTEEKPSLMEVEGTETAVAFEASHRFGSIVSGTSNQRKSDGKIVFLEESDMEDDQPLVIRRTRRNAPADAGSAETRHMSHIDRRPQVNGHAFQLNELNKWGEISSEEHDEAVMLEAAIFGSIPDVTTYHFGYPTRQIPRPQSPTIAAQRLLREQQDDEYLAALQADREKELKAQQEAELRHLEEATAKETAFQKKKHEEEENHRKQLEEEELQRELAAKQASLPQEPPLDDENAVTLLVRMPDGSKRGRRFLKSDKLQFLYDYIDIGKLVMPGSYRLVRPYPRRPFTEAERGLSLSELGMNSKQEALFLELI